MGFRHGLHGLSFVATLARHPLKPVSYVIERVVDFLLAFPDVVEKIPISPSLLWRLAIPV